jgi:hypothetical protein
MLGSRAHGVANAKLSLVYAAVLAGALLAGVGLVRGGERPAAGAAQSVPPPAWPTSPYHGVTDGAGNRIPCLCRFGGAAYRLGDTVCMNTHLGVQLARCDLFMNNTSWIPIGVPCTMSRLDRGRLASLRTGQ